MKTKGGKERSRTGKRAVMDTCRVPESPQSAFIALFAPIRDESWPNVSCNYLFANSENKEHATADKH